MKVSLLITNHNYGHLLGRAIRSALNQSMPKHEYEVIVIDDGSSDDSRIVIEAFGEAIKPVFLPKNVGLGSALNIGILNASGMYIARLDADDIAMHHYLLFLSTFLDFNKDWDWVSCDYYVIDKHENIIDRRKDLIGCASMFRKSALEAVGLYASVRIHEDVDMIQKLKADKRFKHAHIPLPLYKYFIHEGSLTDGGAVYEEKHSDKSR